MGYGVGVIWDSYNRQHVYFRIRFLLSCQHTLLNDCVNLRAMWNNARRLHTRLKFSLVIQTYTVNSNVYNVYIVSWKLIESSGILWDIYIYIYRHVCMYICVISLELSPSTHTHIYIYIYINMFMVLAWEIYILWDTHQYLSNVPGWLLIVSNSDQRLKGNRGFFAWQKSAWINVLNCWLGRKETYHEGKMFHINRSGLYLYPPTIFMQLASYCVSLWTGGADSIYNMPLWQHESVTVIWVYTQIARFMGP